MHNEISIDNLMKGEGQKKKHHYGDLIKKQFQQKYLFQVIFNIKTISTEI